MNLLQKLSVWYHKHCDGDWEHGQGIKIETLDNPGWMITVDLRFIAVDAIDRELLRDWQSDSDWVDIRIKNNLFVAAGDPGKLEFLVEQFLQQFGES